MLRGSKLAQVFRQPPVQGGSFTTSLRRSFANRSVLQSLPPKRAFSSSKSSVWSRFRNSTLRSSGPFRAIRNIRRNGTKSSPTEQASRTQPLSLSERMKEMSKKYGWTVVGIYLGLSVLDFPFCFLAVRLFGTERIGHIEHVLIDGFWSLLESVVPSLKERRERIEAEAVQVAGQDEGLPPITDVQGKNGDASELIGDKADPPLKETDHCLGIWTQLLIAYGVHKSLIFFRIPITLAITPKVVKTLRGWGWKIGKTTPKTA